MKLKVKHHTLTQCEKSGEAPIEVPMCTIMTIQDLCGCLSIYLKAKQTQTPVEVHKGHEPEALPASPWPPA